MAGPVGLHAAIRRFNRVGYGAIRAHDEALVVGGQERLRGVPQLRLLGPTQAADRVPVFTFVLGGLPAMSVARQLQSPRDRRSCWGHGGLAVAQAVRHLRSGERPPLLRIDPADFDRLAEALQQIVRL